MEHKLEPWCIEDEYIIAAAVYYDNNLPHVHQPNNIETGFVVTGFRHCVCYATLAIAAAVMGYDEQRLIDLKKHKKVEGFLTSHNRFVDRFEGFIIARNNGQIIKNTPNYNLSDEIVNKGECYLVSEDLW